MAADRQKLIRNAEKHVSRGKLNAAIDAYLKVLESHPDDTSTLNRVGDLYARLNRLDEAIELFRRAAEHFTEEGFFVKAIAIYKKILRLDPTQLEVSESLGDLQTRQGLASDARQQYETVADGYKNRGDIESAVVVHRKLVDLEPDDPGHRLHLADLLKQTGESAEVLEQYRAISGILLAHDRVEEALRVCREGLGLDPENTDFVHTVVRELRQAGHDAEADGFLELAVERNPNVGAAEATVPGTQAEEEPIELDLEQEEVVLEAAEEEAVEEVEAPDVVAEAVVEAAGEPEPDDATDDEAYELDMEEEEEIDLEIDLVEFAAKEVEPAPEEDASFKELFIEADVLERYGLEDKALEKLEELIGMVPRHFGVHQKLVGLLIDLRHHDQAAELAKSAAEIAEAQGLVEEGESLQAQLIAEGFQVSEEGIEPPVVAVEEEVEVVEVEAEAAPAESPEDLRWLEEAEKPGVEAEAKADEIFDQEEEFFDLASELEKELVEEDKSLEEEELVVAPEDQSIEEIVEGFRKGMAETLSAEDYDTHYNLGIAYREMGLVEEAISEFQLAAKDARYLVDCCSLLAACFLEKGFPELAIKWYNEGLGSPSISEEESLGLSYELGDLYLNIGETDEAKQRFVEIYGVNSEYRDVGAKLAELE